MDANKQKIILDKMNRTAAALEKNHIRASCAPTCADAVRLVEQLLPEGCTIGNGGSVTLTESGVMALLKSSRYQYIDRTKGEQELRAAHNADVFLMSSNAITESGELYNVDGNSNRVSALAHGPKKVIVVAGYNKIVPDLQAAVERVKEIAAPANGVRLGANTPCAKTGRCIACGGAMTAGCSSPNRMCVNYVVTAYQRTERIHVILVGESLGY
ncbi:MULTISPECIES: lactate utilization protein [Caproicibacterium]|uniref:Lactate utilization protein n=1 Tax=Caproicibacterium argilliputei TaxID=3030016 RepID=A0AA97H261_9FIRM|nr:lactate utilization protein [Caproicibacterium argilliputei]WOC33271.1 lactate utilization protein [Caproicibacterium argilliputei]